MLFLTPRRNLNIQLTDDRYTSYIKHMNYDIIHYSHHETNDKENIIKKCVKNKRFIMTGCYQSRKDV